MKYVTRATLVCTLAAAACGPGTTPQGDSGTDSATRCQNSAPTEIFSDRGAYTRELYVDRARGTDDGDGSRERPWRSLAPAGQGRRAGDRVHVAAGTYFECMRIESAQGTEANPIAFTGEGEVRVHCMEGETIAGSGLAYVTIERFIVLASSDEANAIHVDGGSHHIVIRRNEVAGVGRAGDCIKVNATDDVWVLDNDLHNADTALGSAQGIDLVGVHRGLVARNYVHDIRDSQGMFAKGGSSDIVFERNRIERVSSDMADAIGIVLGGSTDRVFFSPLTAPYEGTRIIARNNIVIGADGAGIGSQGCHDCTIANNTLWNTGRRGYAIQLSQGNTGMGVGETVSFNVNVRVANNLVGNPFGTMRAPVQAEAGHRQGLSLSNNWWWNGERDDVFDPGYNTEVGVNGMGSHMNVDPGVVNPDDGADLHLGPQSGARGAGVALDAVTDDYNGNCRTSPPDIGALRAE